MGRPTLSGPGRASPQRSAPRREGQSCNPGPQLPAPSREGQSYTTRSPRLTLALRATEGGPALNPAPPGGRESELRASRSPPGSVRAEAGWGAVKRRCRWEPGLHPKPSGSADCTLPAPAQEPAAPRPDLLPGCSGGRLPAPRAPRPRTPDPGRSPAEQVSGRQGRRPLNAGGGLGGAVSEAAGVRRHLGPSRAAVAPENPEQVR